MLFLSTLQLVNVHINTGRAKKNFFVKIEELSFHIWKTILVLQIYSKYQK